jgi:hypothetical protein
MIERFRIAPDRIVAVFGDVRQHLPHGILDRIRVSALRRSRLLKITAHLLPPALKALSLAEM